LLKKERQKTGKLEIDFAPTPLLANTVEDLLTTQRKERVREWIRDVANLAVLAEKELS
jgi:hypothetical protein